MVYRWLGRVHMDPGRGQKRWLTTSTGQVGNCMNCLARTLQELDLANLLWYLYHYFKYRNRIIDFENQYKKQEGKSCALNKLETLSGYCIRTSEFNPFKGDCAFVKLLNFHSNILQWHQNSKYKMFCLLSKFGSA